MKQLIERVQEELKNMTISDINTYSKADIHIEMELEKSQNRHYFQLKHQLKDMTIKDVEAIRNNDFTIYGQPIVDLKDKKILGVAVLAGWIHPSLGIIEPNDFMHYAEGYESIKEFDLLILEKSIEYIVHHEKVFETIRLHIHVSLETLKDKALYTLLNRYDLDEIASKIVFEIQNASIEELLLDEVLVLRERGFSFSIGNFGTGDTLLDRISEAKPTYVKIDKCLVHSLVENPQDGILLKTILQICEKKNIDVIAEGVETVEQIEFLQARNCYKLQGDYFLEPQELVYLIQHFKESVSIIEAKINGLQKVDVFSSSFYNRGQVYVQHVNGHYGFVEPNIQLAQKLDYPLEAIHEMGMADIIPKNELSYFEDAVAIARRTNEIIIVNTYIHGRHQRTYKARCALKYVEKDLFTLYMEFVDDDQADSELLGLSKSYTEAFYKSPIGMLIVDSHYKVIKCNHSGEAIIGLKTSEILGYDLRTIFRKNIKKLNRLFDVAYKASYAEDRLIYDDAQGRVIVSQWIVSCIENVESDEKRYICIIQDVTKQVMLEKEKNKVYHALDQSKSAIFMTDYEGKIQYINNTFTSMTGFESGEAFGHKMNIVYSGEQSETFYKDLWTTIKSGEAWNGELKNKKKNGDYYWCKESIYPIREDRGIIGFMGIQQDVTEEKKLMEMNNQLKNRLYEQDKIASLGLLTSGIIHEINNPLSYIQMSVTYLLDEITRLDIPDEGVSYEIKEAIDDISEGVHQIKEIASGLKRYVYKNDDEVMESISMVEIINEVLTLTKNEYKYHVNVELSYDENQEIIVKGYASKLKQVFMNLIINATHAIVAKGLESLGLIKIQMEVRDGMVMVRVTDNGIGMSEEIKEKIFEPLFTTKAQGIGTGLGLSVSKQIIENEHSGKITCNSTLGDGTTFSIELKQFVTS